MKALCIREPWASMLLFREKTIETRTWKTRYRGKILLCASKTPRSPRSGKAFATARLIDCVPMTKAHEAQACCEVYDGAYAWILSQVSPIKPFPVRGQLGLFEVDYNEPPIH